MNDKLTYEESIPTHGDHRPLWPKFGEYRYVPPQRWLHNIEHGSVVMLYHPCAHHEMVNRLRELVTGCVRKHIITPYAKLSTTRVRPIVVVLFFFWRSSWSTTTCVSFSLWRWWRGDVGWRWRTWRKRRSSSSSRKKVRNTFEY